MPYVTTTSGTANYASDIFPKSASPEWDPVAVFVREARKQRLLVYPTVCLLSSGHEQPAGILALHREWALRKPDGEPSGYVSCAHPEALEWILSYLQEILTKFEPDGIMLDYMRFPNRHYRLDEGAERAFLATLPDATEGTVIDVKNERLLAYKRQCLTEFVERVSGRIRELRPGIQIAMYTWGPHVLGNHPNSQDWVTWSKLGYVDVVNVSGYIYPNKYGEKYLELFEERMGQSVALMREASSKTQLTLCLGVKTSHGSVTSAQDIQAYLVKAKAAGVRGLGVFTWSYLQPYLDEVLKEGYLRDYLSEK